MSRPLRFVAASVLAVLACTPGRAAAQSTRPFQHLDAEDGLSQASVTSIAQDPLGFMWFGTQDGLNRFDGYGITVFRHVPGDSTSLGSNYVNDLLVDRAGTLWIGTYGGVSRYVQATGRFETWSGGPDDASGLPSTTVRVILEDSGGRMWLGTHEGLARWDVATGRFQAYVPEGMSEESRNVRSLEEGPDGTLWVGTNAGLRLFDPSSESWRHLAIAGEEILPATVVWSVLRDRAGIMWVGSADQGMLRVDVANSRLTWFRMGDAADEIPSDDVRRIYEDSRGELWVGTFDGLSVMDRARGTFTTWKHESTDPTSLSQNSVWAIREAADGLLWFGTMNAGVNTYDPLTGAFTNYRHRPGDPTSLPSNLVYEVRGGPDGTIWVGTRGGGLSRFDPASGTFRSYRHDAADPSSLPADYVVAVDIDAAGYVWVGTLNDGLGRFDPNTGRMRHYPADPERQNGDWIRDVLVDPDGRVWAGTSGGGLSRVDPTTGRTEVFVNDEGDPSSLSSNYVRALYLDRSGTLWVGTYGNGANRFNRETSTFQQFLHDPQDSSTLGSPFVRSIFEDSRGHVWFSTDAGVSVLDRATGLFTRYGVSDGLANGVVYGMLEDERGRLWMSTNDGLSRFDPARGSFSNLNVEEGLPSREFNTGAFYEDPTGRMYFGGVNGLTAFNPDSVAEDVFAPPVVLTDFQLFNVSVPVSDSTVLPKHVSVLDEIRLAHGMRVFTVEFAGLNYRYPERTRYAYRLLGFDDRWISTPSSYRRATFTNLPPGNYTFQVRSSTRDGEWGEAGASIGLTVLPAYWQTLWFRSFVLLLLVGGTVGWVAWHQRDLRSRNVLLERRVQERTDELQKSLGELRESIAHIKQLEGLLPICSSCKQIRVEGGDPNNQADWQPVERYIGERTDAAFSHGICPDCIERLYPELKDGM